MGSRAARVCSKIGCANLIYGSGSLCADHAREAQAQRQANSSRPRPNVRQLYGPEWPEFSRRYLAAHPWCRICGKRAHHTDHIIAVSAGGAVFEEANLQPLCRSHHGKKTASQDGGFGNTKK